MARVAERRMHAVFWWVNLREIDCFEDIGVDRRIIFKWLFKSYVHKINKCYNSRVSRISNN